MSPATPPCPSFARTTTCGACRCSNSQWRQRRRHARRRSLHADLQRRAMGRATLWHGRPVASTAAASATPGYANFGMVPKKAPPPQLFRGAGSTPSTSQSWTPEPQKGRRTSDAVEDSYGTATGFGTGGHVHDSNVRPQPSDWETHSRRPCGDVLAENGMDAPEQGVTTSSASPGGQGVTPPGRLVAIGDAVGRIRPDFRRSYSSQGAMQVCVSVCMEADSSSAKKP